MEDRPKFDSPVRPQSGAFQLNLIADRARIYILDASTDFLTWIPLPQQALTTSLVILRRQL